MPYFRIVRTQGDVEYTATDYTELTDNQLSESGIASIHQWSGEDNDFIEIRRGPQEMTP